MDDMDKCPHPGCDEVEEYGCKCPRSDRTCKNGHSWHKCTVCKCVVPGASDHSKDTNTCTCIEITGWFKDPPDVPGLYWYYGWVCGKWEKENIGRSRPEWHLVKVVKGGNGPIRMMNGHFLFDYKPLKGLFIKAELPEVPEID